MATSLRSSLTIRAALLGGLLLPAVSYGICISPVITPIECDFKDEDTNLILNQPAKKFIQDEHVKRVLADSATFIELYYNTTKTTGDAAIIADVARMAAEIRKVEAAQVANTALMLANDPLNLKPLYTDVLCEALWTSIDTTANVAGYPVGNRECPTTDQLLINIGNIQALDDRAQEIEAILVNQSRDIGDVWGDVGDDIQRVRDQFNSLQTLSHNLTADDVVTQYDERYSSFDEMIASPILTADEWTERYKLIDETVNSTIRDTLMATQANAKSMLGEQFFQTEAEILANNTVPYLADTEELTMRNQKSRDSIGRMQQMELRNMGDSLSAQAWVDITSQQNAHGFMVGNDMAKEHSTQNYREALSVQLRRELPPIPERQRFGNEPIYLP